MIFIANIKLVYISFTIKTFPNLPYPNFEIILKFYLFRLFLDVDNLKDP